MRRFFHFTILMRFYLNGAYTIVIKIHDLLLRGWEEMGNRKKPKYKIGDTVVITIYGTVGKITDIKILFLFGKNYVIILIPTLGVIQNGTSRNLSQIIKKRARVRY